MRGVKVRGTHGGVVMALEEQIVEWATTRPAWQRKVMARVAAGNPLSEDECDQLITDLLTSTPITDTDFSLEQLPQTTSSSPPISLVSISDLSHVNALKSDAPLTFEQPGITIIYGDNGSGKSGYARLLKRIARARHQEDVLSDVFRDTAVAKPEATVTVQVGGQERLVLRPNAAIPELKKVLFSDSSCRDSYIASESGFPYRPSALFVMDGLITACLAIRARLDAQIEENTKAAKSLPVVDPTISITEVGRYISGLSWNSSLAELDRLITTIEQAPEDIQELRAQEARLASVDMAGERLRLTREAEKLDAVISHLGHLERELGKDALANLTQARSDLNALAEAADIAAQGFVSELPGTGGSAWKELWEAARRYSAVAYPNGAFPIVSEDGACVLCQQPLGADARALLTRFERFVQDNTQSRLRTARDTWQQRAERFSRPHPDSGGATTHLDDLAANNASVVEEARTMIVEFATSRESVANAIVTAGDFPRAPSPVSAVIMRLRDAAAKARSDADSLGNLEAQRARLEGVAAKRRELELLEEVKRARADIVDEIDRRKGRATLEAFKNEASTGPVTTKIAQLAEDHITEVVRDTFTRESDRLLLERVTVAKTRHDRGALLHQPKLVGARQNVTLPRVFSEGERTALGLSAFFTEVQLDDSGSVIILDDPVSSLDHVRRARVASRLAALAQARQVVVFTHDVAFVSELKREAQGLSVPVGERSVTRSRGGEKEPGQCSTEHPWKAKDVTERLHDLRMELARIKRDHATWDDRTYEDWVAAWAGRLSETWERIFSQEILSQVLADGGLEVHPRMVKVLTRFSQTDDAEFQASYSRVSQWAPRHDKSALTNYVAPAVADLEAELLLVDGWFKRIKGYRA
jgi:energy-coupling factor transporter ATP-binding protein EcfA2